MGGRGSMGGTRSTYRGDSTRLFRQQQQQGTDTGKSGSGGGGGGSSKSVGKSSASANTGGVTNGQGGSGSGGGGSSVETKTPTTDINDLNPPPDVDLEGLFQQSPEYRAFDKKYEDASEAVYNQKYKDTYSKWLQSQNVEDAPSGADEFLPFRRKDTLDRNGQNLINDIEAVNPRYDKSDPNRTGENTQNCQRCTAAVELRAQGYDVVAVPLTEGYLSSQLRPDGKVRQTRASWTDIANMWEDADGNKAKWKQMPIRRPDGTLRSNGAQAAFTESVLKKQPEGARGFIGVKWRGDDAGAHIFNWEIRDGEVYWIDGQTNVHGPEMFTKDDGKYNWKLQFDNEWGLRVFRTDDKKPTAEALTWVRERTIEEKNAPTFTELKEWLPTRAAQYEEDGFGETQIEWLNWAFYEGWNQVRTGRVGAPPYSVTNNEVVNPEFLQEAFEDGQAWARRPA